MNMRCTRRNWIHDMIARGVLLASYHEETDN